MTDLHAALTEALRSEFAEWLEPEDVDEIAWDRKAAAILAHPAMADLARKAAAWEMGEEGIRQTIKQWLGSQRLSLYSSKDIDNMVKGVVIFAAALSAEDER